MAGPRRRGAPHIRDVAAHAGVGVGTVSRVINGGAGVTPAKRERVLSAIEDLGYRPSSAARSLSLGRTATVGVLAPFFANPGTTARLRSINDVAAEAGYNLMIFNVEAPQQRAAAFRDFARRDRVDGVLIVSLPVADAEVEALRREGVAAVLVNVGHPALSRVVSDDVAGGELATAHLLARGHRRIGFVGDAPGSPLGFTSSEERRLGYCRALESAGLVADPALVRRGTHGREHARAAAEDLLATDTPPTAIFAASDSQAIGVLEAADRAGLRVPGDLAVIGYDDIDIAEAFGLTTVRQPLAESGAKGMGILLRELRGSAAGPEELVQPLSLVERQTT
jgi:LacI family transcriptional regulator/LacI family repressor for deo operon, udp, cdd, tsx, nupC, and nupG